jgi:ABC-2 type transport system ATP-binding protein
MDEAEQLADRVAIIDNGQLIALDTPAALTRIGSGNAVRFTGTPGLDIAGLSALPSATEAREERTGVYVIETHDAPALLAELTAWLRDAKAELTALHVGHGSLEDVFLRLTGKEMRV